MNNKAQEISPGGFLMAVIGFVLAWVMAMKMGAGIFWRIIDSLITGAVCYFIAYFILNK